MHKKTSKISMSMHSQFPSPAASSFAAMVFASMEASVGGRVMGGAGACKTSAAILMAAILYSCWA